jgi:S1-C subfamily serine protease
MQLAQRGTSSATITEHLLDRVKPYCFLQVALACVCCTMLAQTNDTAAMVYRKSAPAVFVISRHNSAGQPVSFGSGFLIDKNILVTNAHVVEGGGTFL